MPKNFQREEKDPRQKNETWVAPPNEAPPKLENDRKMPPEFWEKTIHTNLNPRKLLMKNEGRM